MSNTNDLTLIKLKSRVIYYPHNEFRLHHMQMSDMFMGDRGHMPTNETVDIHYAPIIEWNGHRIAFDETESEAVENGFSIYDYIADITKAMERAQAEECVVRRKLVSTSMTLQNELSCVVSRKDELQQKNKKLTSKLNWSIGAIFILSLALAVL